MGVRHPYAFLYLPKGHALVGASTTEDVTQNGECRTGNLPLCLPLIPHDLLRGHPTTLVREVIRHSC